MSQHSRTPRAVGLRFRVCVYSSGIVGAGGGLAEERHAPPPPAANAGAAAMAGAGTHAPRDTLDAASIADASLESDAGAADLCPSEAVFCCDNWTGLRSLPTCINGYTQCGERLDLQTVDSDCLRTPDVCHVESLSELAGKACSSGELSCPFGRGCSACRCECLESTLLWSCQCNARLSDDARFAP